MLERGVPMHTVTKFRNIAIGASGDESTTVSPVHLRDLTPSRLGAMLPMWNFLKGHAFRATREGESIIEPLVREAELLEGRGGKCWNGQRGSLRGLPVV